MKTLLITSAEQQAGVTLLASSIAAGLVAEQGCRVLLVDAKSPRLANESTPSDIPGLFKLIGSSSNPGNMAENLVTLKSIFAGAAGAFDVIVIDAAPIVDSALARGLAGQVDGVLLVAESDRSATSNINRAKELLDRGKARLIGGALNRSGRYLPRWIAAQG